MAATSLVVVPLVVAARPVSDPDVDAQQLLARIRAADDVAYTGYVEAHGNLPLPTTDEFDSVANLFGGSSRLRVWWESGEAWRVDRLSASGETDLFHAGSQTTTWDYERLRTTSTLDALVFLPRAVELLPPRLAELVLTDLRTEELSRLPAIRVAGRQAPGLRLTPSVPQSSIEHIDIWADADSGLPLRVQIVGDGDGDESPPIDTSFAELTLGQPSTQALTFDPPAGSRPSSSGLGSDSLLGHIPAVVRTPQLAGLPAIGSSPPGLFTRYGRGVTQFLVLGLDDDVAGPLRRQLASATGAVVDEDGSALAAGPLNLRLSPHRHFEPSWLLVGTVDEPTMRRAARQIDQLRGTAAGGDGS